MTNLLLLLSAMLSALIGVGPVVRMTQAPVAVASAPKVQAIATASRHVVVRPLPALPRIAALIGMGIVILLFVPAADPAWKMRRRE